ncbi:hypothetical protein C8Q69DRAFT_48605 [Paecilomyces variotii]|uniref:Uncharacterized protein n=1 Tax=Byssochlamys spectabilis TaxID=264951 RepID=A0A443I7Q5_BYSSP|nr:hypothetical protein C8Q69DRAFT_48605 [Paecilomyces variotii]RWR00131.1 hypothetical protein C8Q69DRAFT_48605 [Paecilomyces variotii]
MRLHPALQLFLSLQMRGKAIRCQWLSGRMQTLNIYMTASTWMACWNLSYLHYSSASDSCSCVLISDSLSLRRPLSRPYLRNDRCLASPGTF